ncbi:MAG: WecB/TagA/CpsF family glycosyltransferase [Ectothiorhodospiraceae bacterium]|nr:WecB/TagA/CpsF family glycosyltransferase [Ectothiorhodospiraceae bacterium]
MSGYGSGAALPIAGFPVQQMHADDLVNLLLDAHRAGEQRLLFFVNANFVIQCECLMPQLRDPSVLLVNDGVGMDVAGWLVHRQAFPDNLNGTDFVPYLLQRANAGADGGLRAFLLGAKPGIARRAGEELLSRGVKVVGALDGYGESRDTEQVVDTINRSGADVVLVAMGNPLQEQWILKHRGVLDARLLVGVGALLDFLAGDKPRAPELIRRLRLEWLYRLSLEPTRLLRRYTLDMARFLLLSLRRGKRALTGPESGGTAEK